MKNLIFAMIISFIPITISLSQEVVVYEINDQYNFWGYDIMIKQGSMIDEYLILYGILKESSIALIIIYDSDTDDEYVMTLKDARIIHMLASESYLNRKKNEYIIGDSTELIINRLYGVWFILIRNMKHDMKVVIHEKAITRFLAVLNTMLYE